MGKCAQMRPGYLGTALTVMAITPDVLRTLVLLSVAPLYKLMVTLFGLKANVLDKDGFVGTDFIGIARTTGNCFPDDIGR